MTGTDHADRSFDELVTTALRSHVADVAADDALLDRIRASVGDDLAGRGGRRPRGRSVWLLGAAAAVAVLVAAVGWALADRAGEQGVVSGDGPGGSTAPGQTTPSTTDAVPAALPDRAIVTVTEPDGSTQRLVLLDLDRGIEIGTLGPMADRGCTLDGGDLCRSTVTHTAVSANDDLFVERCCGDGGSVDRYADLDPDTGALGDSRAYLAGSFPTIDPSGTRLAVATRTSIVIRDLVSGRAEHAIGLGANTSAGADPTGLAWSPDGRSLAVSLLGQEGGRVVVVPADADTLDEGAEVDRGTPLAVQAWTTHQRLWALAADDGSTAARVVAIDLAAGTDGASRVGFDVLARQVVADRTGTYLYVVTTEGLRRADASARTPDRLVTGRTILVAADGELLGGATVFRAHDCAVSGAPTVEVPDVVGRQLADARRLLEGAGLVVIDVGVPAGDDTSDTAVVTAQEPAGGTSVPAGACVGMRTAS